MTLQDPRHMNEDAAFFRRDLIKLEKEILLNKETLTKLGQYEYLRYLEEEKS